MPFPQEVNNDVPNMLSYFSLLYNSSFRRNRSGKNRFVRKKDERSEYSAKAEKGCKKTDPDHFTPANKTGISPL